MRALIPLFWLLACGSEPAVGSAPSPSPAVAVAAITATAAVADAAVPAGFRNGDGHLACPVMGDTVASAETAAGHVDYQGVRYYFCCNSCEVLFNAEPEKYAQGRYLNEIGVLHGTDAGTCGE